jgi:retron-type reverse transcriptase
MRKKLKDIYKEIYDFDNLYNAYVCARKNKRYRKDVLKFTDNLEENLINIQNKLIYNQYEVGRYKEFYVHEPKKRLILSLPFEDRIVQWSLFNALNPYFEKGYIKDSYGCRVNKGAHGAIERLQYWLKKIDRSGKKYYCLKMDISKYFYRVDHNILINILNKYIDDKDTLELLRKIIKCESSCGFQDEFMDIDENSRTTKRGMPIGNLSSQMFANLYLNELDQFVKRELRMKYYIRYMDDFLILSDDKKELHRLLEEINIFLKEELNLNLNNKTSLNPVNTGIEFVGYRIWSTHIKLRKSTTKRIKSRLKYLKKQYSKKRIPFSRIDSTVQSYMGMLKHCNSYNLQKNLFESFVLKRDDELS